ncbi:MAG TPA: hypothetical protein VLV83_05130 [Acidobacteriota bacterium]|nr:hypothetical protein [Acidobacteriota bacterium]
MRKWITPMAALMLTAFLSLTWTVGWAGDAGTPSQSVVDAFEKLKSLEGTWKGTNGQGEEVELTFELTGNGSAVYSRYSVNGTEHEHDMATVYHLEGARLMLTHYCAMANQPRMISTSGLQGNALQFQFLDVGNADASKDGHMHKAAYQFLSDNHFTTDWTWFEGGESRFTATVDVKRVK